MTFAAHSIDFHRHVASGRAPAGSTARRSGLLARLFGALVESREREAERNVEAYLARTGYRFTDSIEREIEANMFKGGWNPRR